MRRPGSALRRAILLATVPLAMLGSGFVVWQASYSAFTATTSNNGNSWTTGTVAINNDESATVAFPNLTNLVPDGSRNSITLPNGGAYAAGSTSSGGSACIKVTYTGSVTSEIRMWATVGGADAATLGTWILFSVDMVNGATGDGTNLSCSTFPVSSSTIYGASPNSTATLGGFPSDWTTAGTAGTVWTGATSAAGVKWFRLSWLIPNSTNQTAAATRNVTANFTWEAHSS